MKFNKKIDDLRDKMRTEGLDALLVSTPENRRYLSGFSGSAGYLIISDSEAILATDFRYIEQASKQASGFRIERIAGSFDWFPRLMLDIGVGRIGFESRGMTVDVHVAFKNAIDRVEQSHCLTFIATIDLVENLRTVKSADDVKLITRAVEIADEAFDIVAPTVEPGMTELDVAWDLERTMRECGAESISFDIIVGSGANGALPHHSPSNKVIVEGESVVIDMGARYQGFCSDLTRTIFIGQPDDTFERVYTTVLHAQIEAEKRARVGMTGGEVDAIARNIISEAGYGKDFGHSLGHGVGLAVHESPVVGPKSTERIEEGMVFTIEPGIYLTGWGGVRIEDIVVMENGRARVISNAKKLQVEK